MGLDRVVEDLGRRIAQRSAALEYLVRGWVRVRVRVRVRLGSGLGLGFG